MAENDEILEALCQYFASEAAFGLEDYLPLARKHFAAESEGPISSQVLGTVDATDALVKEAPATVSQPVLSKTEQLAAIAREAAACRACQLGESRRQVVPGQGDADSRLLFVGEAPGVDEDASGLAFVGAAGQLLTKMIGAMGFEREEVFIANMLKCRPPENRNPMENELLACRGFMDRQIEIIQPDIICCLGAFSSRAILGQGGSLAAMRGRIHQVNGRAVVATYHPSYLLRSPSEKRAAWQDLQMVMAFLRHES